ncbi:hypothetical protein L484_010476 [Morus notabilis]|uniref:Uncharacterized protein n=1 Tax=Morus notabilis TaxID=981085 RepID=W9RBG5_9ROSA|nr:hypothetical protein L484_010476 [Morus notabilis]
MKISRPQKEPPKKAVGLSSADDEGNENIVPEVLRDRRGYRKGIGSTLSQRNIIQVPQQRQPNCEELGDWFQHIYRQLNKANINVPPPPSAFRPPILPPADDEDKSDNDDANLETH